MWSHNRPKTLASSAMNHLIEEFLFMFSCLFIASNRLRLQREDANAWHSTQLWCLQRVHLLINMNEFNEAIDQNRLSLLGHNQAPVSTVIISHLISMNRTFHGCVSCCTNNFKWQQGILYCTRMPLNATS